MVNPEMARGVQETAWKHSSMSWTGLERPQVWISIETPSVVGVKDDTYYVVTEIYTFYLGMKIC